VKRRLRQLRGVIGYGGHYARRIGAWREVQAQEQRSAGAERTDIQPYVAYRLRLRIAQSDDTTRLEVRDPRDIQTSIASGGADWIAAVRCGVGQ